MSSRVGAVGAHSQDNASHGPNQWTECARPKPPEPRARVAPRKERSRPWCGSLDGDFEFT